jgi:hypothetical protein
MLVDAIREAYARQQTPLGEGKEIIIVGKRR